MKKSLFPLMLFVSAMYFGQPGGGPGNPPGNGGEPNPDNPPSNEGGTRPINPPTSNEQSGTNSLGSSHLNFERFLVAGPQAEQMITDYLAPAVIGIMNASSLSWYTTAETHERWGFDISVSGLAAFVPSSATTFTAEQTPNFTSEENELATIFGKNGVMPTMTGHIIVDGGKYENTLEAPTGAGLGTNVTPNAVFQAGLGIGWGTEIKTRFMPKVGTSTFKAGSWGVALQHDLSQYLPFGDKKPLFVSVLGGYSSSYGTWTFDDPEDYAWEGDNQMTDFDAQTWTFQLIASTNFELVNLYGGFGYNSSQGSYQMNGTYKVVYTNVNSSYDPETITYENPASGEYTVNGMNATIGARLNLYAFNIFFDYTFKDYNVANLGIAVSFN